jgi:hypothetical protein
MVGILKRSSNRCSEVKRFTTSPRHLARGAARRHGGSDGARACGARHFGALALTGAMVLGRLRPCRG